MNLEQDALSQKIQYQQLILQLQKKYHRDVESIREQYASKLKSESSKIEGIKENHLRDKKRAEMQLVEMEE